jgi:hypothetical protein
MLPAPWRVLPIRPSDLRPGTIAADDWRTPSNPLTSVTKRHTVALTPRTSNLAFLVLSVEESKLLPAVTGGSARLTEVTLSVQ